MNGKTGSIYNYIHSYNYNSTSNNIFTSNYNLTSPYNNPSSNNITPSYNYIYSSNYILPSDYNLLTIIFSHLIVMLFFWGVNPFIFLLGGQLECYRRANSSLLGITCKSGRSKSYETIRKSYIMGEDSCFKMYGWWI